MRHVFTRKNKFLSLVLAVVLSLNFMAVVAMLAPGAVQAGRLSNASDSLSDPRAGASSTHTFSFTVDTSSTLQEIRLQFSTTATGNSKPSGLDLTSATLGSLTNMDAGWTLNTGSAASGLLEIQHTNGGEDLGAAVVTIPIQAITNSGITDCQSSVSSSDTCYVQIQTSTTTGVWDDSVVDETTVTYTVVQAVTVSATVDPSFTLVISSVGASTVVGGVTTSAASTVTTLPFGNLTAGTPKYLAHGLNVTTNANSGYNVTMTMLSQMSGTYSGNNIDPFNGTNVSWSNPIPWTEPTGTSPNTDTGWIGAYTSDSDVSQFAAGEFGPVNDTANTVMTSTSSDNGSSTVYVLYAIETNVYQPADSYTGTLVYTGTPTY